MPITMNHGPMYGKARVCAVEECMAIQISELRPDEAAEVAALWHAHGDATPVDEACKLVSDHLHRFSGLSLVAREARQIVGLVLVGRDAVGSYRNHLCLHPEHTQDGVDRQLLDKAMVKLHAKGIRKFRLQGIGESGVQAMWESVRWLRAEGSTAAAVVPQEAESAVSEATETVAEAAPESQDAAVTETAAVETAADAAETPAAAK